MEESAFCAGALEAGPPEEACPDTVVEAAAAGQFAIECYRDRAWASCPPRSLVAIRLQAQDLRGVLLQILGREPTIEEVADALRVEGEAAQVEAVGLAAPASIG